MRRHYLLASIAVLALSGLGFWTWRRFAPGSAPIVAQSRTPLPPTDCPVAAATADNASRVQPAGAFPVGKPLNSPQAGDPELPGSFMSIEPRVMKNPEFRAAMHDQQRLALEDEFRDLPRILGLAGDQSDRLFDLLAEQQLRIFDLRWQKPEPGKTFRDQMQEVRATNAAEVAELLGPSNTIRYQEFRASLQGRAEVNSVRAELARGWEPMRESQYEPMLAVVNVELQRLNQELSDLGPGAGLDPANETRRVALTVAANQRILEAARPILSSAQLSVLADLYQRQHLQMESQDALNRLRNEAAASAAQDLTPK